MTEKPSADTRAGKRERPSRRAPVVRLLLLAAAVAVAAVLGSTTARYMKKWMTNDSLVTAGSFYFDSEELDKTVRELPVNVSDQAEFSFTLKNYVVEKYKTKDQIEYTCTVTDVRGNPIEVLWRGGSGDSTGTTGKELTGTLKGEEKPTATVTCLIPAAAFGEDRTGQLTVTAAANKPYTAELTAYVTLSEGNSDVRWEVTDQGAASGAVAVTLYNTSGQERRVNLKVRNNDDLKLVADPTWEIVPDGNGDLRVPAKSVVSVVYLKKNISGESEDRFTKDNFTFSDLGPVTDP